MNLFSFFIADYGDNANDLEEPKDVPTCIVSGCNFRFNSKQKRFKVYPFPEAENIVTKWLQKLGISNLNPSPLSLSGVCYRHFHEHDIVLTHERNKSGHVRIKKRLKPSAVPSLHLTNDSSNSKYKQFPTTREQKEEIVNAKHNENGWWSCNSCSSGNFLFFFELFAHWRECHDFNPNLLKYHYEKITLDNQIDRDVILAQDGWACQACEGGEKFDHKFQLVSHWHKHHSNPDVTYEVCQWCSELFSSPECSTLVRAYYKKKH